MLNFVPLRQQNKLTLSSLMNDDMNKNLRTKQLEKSLQ